MVVVKGLEFILLTDRKVDIRNFFTATAMAKKRSSSGEGEPPNKKPTSNNKNKTDFSTIDFSSKDGDFKVKEGILKLVSTSVINPGFFWAPSGRLWEAPGLQ